jgi:hypothetical protein
LTPNIGLQTILLTSRRSVGINAALDLCNALLVAENHRGDGDSATHKDRNDRD